MSKNKNNIKQKLKLLYLKIKKTKTTHFIFLGILVLSVVNISIMSLFFYDNDYNYKIMNISYISAITPEQDVNETLYTNVIKIKEFNLNNATIGDLVIIYDDFSTNEYWVEKIIDINETTKEITVTYDEVSNNNISYNNIYGTYIKKANIFGTIYHTAMFTRGYILLVFSHIFILAAYYTYFILHVKEPKKRI
ncbi:MAG: hypothetical protein K9L74_01295 [Candidatus Izimaplasma sp.]|nr:hypothetical protein [Candidatus Izimaplasma bacterium]